VGISPLPEVHYNSQNTQKKFGSKKFKHNFKRKWNNIRQNYKASKGHNKGKSLKKTALKFVKGVVVTTTTPGGATFPGIWLNYTINLLVSKFKGTSLNITSLLDLLMPVAPKMFLRNTMKVFLRNTTIIRSHRSWTAYPTLTICS
jgi:hypothetical protein